MAKLPKILCLATLALLLLFILQGATGIIPVRHLKGAYVGTEWPRWSKADVLSGQWQRGCDQYAKEHHGFREGAIRLYNQLLWTCFHQSTNPGAVLVGRDNYLFEPYFVDEYYTGCSTHFFDTVDAEAAMVARCRRTADSLARLQALLEQHGTHLFVAMLPGKDRLCPQHLPLRTDGCPHATAYDTYSALFDSLGVRHIDLLDNFLSLRGRVPYALFTPTGTHWSNIASTYAFDSVMRFMQTFGPAIRPVTLGQPYYAKTREPDADLDELLNKIFYIPTPRNQYVDVALTADTVPHNPSLIVVGDSFFWNILYNFPIQDLFSNFRYWYYFSTIYYDSDHDNVADIDLSAQLLGTDYVMLSYCDVQLYNLGNGFIGRALHELTTEK